MALVHSSPKIVTDNLLLYLDAANTKSYPGTGATWTDISSNGNNGTIDGATFNTNVFSFDGTNDDVEITDTESGGTGGGLNTYDLLSGSNNYSISLWFQTTSFPANTSWGISPVLFKAGQRAIYILHGDSTAVDKLAFHGNWSSGGWTYTVQSNTLLVNTWYNICFTYNASTGFVCYQNGSSVDTGSTNSANRYYNDNSFIGRVSDADSSTSTRYWNGKMAIFSIYEETLTSSEVKQNFNALKGRFGL